MSREKKSMWNFIRYMIYIRGGGLKRPGGIHPNQWFPVPSMSPKHQKGAETMDVSAVTSVNMGDN